MHMADALVSTPVAGAVTIIAASLVYVACRKVKESPNEQIIPLMGVMGAFIFAAQMINFTIPGTGSSGHIVGGVLLAALLGRWPAFLTLTSVLILQAFLFADGGILALGCNIVNMGGFTCLIAYPLLFKPLIKKKSSTLMLFICSILTSMVGLEMGAFAVTIETWLSGITVLPLERFLLFMLPIHLVIGILEGIATGFVLVYIKKTQPGFFQLPEMEFSPIDKHAPRFNLKPMLLVFSLLALVLGSAFSFIASSFPDGLEWSIDKVTEGMVLPISDETPHILAQLLQDYTAIMPDYNTSFAGIIGGILFIVAALVISKLYKQRYN